jgi:hypothetical protein
MAIKRLGYDKIDRILKIYIIIINVNMNFNILLRFKWPTCINMHTTYLKILVIYLETYF